MEQELQRLKKIRDDIELMVRLSRGNWTTIARESGCRPQTLHRLSADEDYDPVLSELAKLDAWFQVNGVKRKRTAPSKENREALRAKLESARQARQQIDAFPQ